MKPFLKTVRDIKIERGELARRSYGMIETSSGQLASVKLKPWPKIGSLMEAHWIQSMKSRRHQTDVCRLYYNQPLWHRNYLALAYVESSLNTSLKTLYAALDVLNAIAYLKKSDAIIAEVTTNHLSDRFMVRRGWEPFLENSSRRHWIKRFYGVYPEKTTRFFQESKLSRDEVAMPV
jgi:hypothetical protein